ncbi:Rid family hydrolase [Lyngbya sp. PCC 8106]|uniref:Rid family hydrolase n=1 Tax=Lyngbya sp. (strain PCC 8106) TaxID=313612 RepID=UPI0000EACE71|nr:Rid family hydrolase [Lyngbya sp. PCC 8106]EAW36102.1 Endoribonuclease L-PSP [Lyngbya sp. PCC 8106]
MVHSTSVRRTFSGAPGESQVGYCRAVQVANQIYITGTAPVAADGQVFAPGDAFEIFQQTLQNLDADLSGVVRTRMFVTNISRSSTLDRSSDVN